MWYAFRMDTERSTSESATSYDWILSANMPGYLPDADPDIFRATEAEARERFAAEYLFQTGDDPDAEQMADMYANLPGGYILICESIR